MLSICHLEMICQCGIIWSKFICWETIKQICQYLMWTMAFSMIGALPHFDSLLMSAMWSVLFRFLTTEPKYSTWFYHWLIHWRACWLHMPCHTEVWAIQSMRHNEKKEMEWPSHLEVCTGPLRITSSALYTRLQNYFSHPSLVIYFRFPNPTH
jgi:hypothetical protein